MNKIIFLTLAFVFTMCFAFAQNVTEKNGTVCFPTIADYEYFAENPDNRADIGNVVNKFKTISILKAVYVEPTDNTEGIPEFLQEILNTDYITTIGSFYVKLDMLNQRALAIQHNVAGAYNTLVTNNLTATGLLQFAFDDGNALEIMEGIETGNGSINNYKQRIIKITDEEMATTAVTRGPSENIYANEPLNCANPSGNEYKINQAWGLQYTESSCSAPGNNFATNSGDLKLVYQKVGIYFSLIAKEKCRKVCVYGGNANTAQTISVEMYLQGTVRYKRCGQGDMSSNNLQNYQNTNDKSWRPFESSRRLTKYDFTVQFKQRDSRSGEKVFPIMNIMWGY